MNMQEKPVIFITGGTRGLGFAFVEKFKNNAWTVATCSTKKSNNLPEVADLNLICDISNLNNVRNAIDAIIQKFGRIDAVINNAGVAGSNSLNTEDNDDFWHRIIDVNLHGTYYLSKYVLPYLPDNTGRILNISSVLGLKGVPDQTAYCAAKHAVLGLTKALAHYTASRRITVNALCPGWIRTDMAATRMQELSLSEENLVANVPLGRMLEVGEIADMAYFLIASDAAAGMTGQAITIDGGVLA